MVDVLDVPYTKLQEWLLTRHKLKDGWAEQLRDVQKRLATAVSELPDVPGVASLLGRPTTTYFHALQVMEFLEEAAAAKGKVKDFFGRYTDDSLRTWSSLLSDYKRNNVYLAEAAQVLVQYGAYDIPAMKLQLTNNDRHMRDLQRKRLDSTRTAASYRRQLQQLCKEFGIPGDNFVKEVAALVRQLPAEFELVQRNLLAADFLEALRYFDQFCAFMTKDVAGAAPASDSLPALRRYITCCQDGAHPALPDDMRLLLAGDSAGAAEEAKSSGDGGSGSSGSGDGSSGEVAEISWDFETTDSSAASATDAVAEIAWDFSTEAAGDGADAGAVDWGISVESAGDSGAPAEEKEEEVAEIDWDFSVEESGDAAAAAAAATVVHDVTAEGDSAAVPGSLLYDSDTRAALEVELLELQAFMDARAEELVGDVVFLDQFQGADPLVLSQSSESVARYCAAVDTALASLTSERCLQLLMIRSSDKYRTRLISQLQGKLDYAAKMDAAAATAAEKRDALASESARLRPQVDELRTATMWLKRHTERGMAEMLSGIEVNIIGDINSL
eukprot:PLAT11384.1.p1 GENE.PLAT11384.1~~PLAT11384.1.p1  ORF type:complete len:557 (+),score=293.56 PLAT11384.1:22-1692(+)